MEGLVSARKGAGRLSTALVIVCQMAGVGILQLPYVLRQGGWVCLGFIVACALSTNYTAKLLIRACYAGGPVPVCDSYGSLGLLAFGRAGRAVAVFFESTTLIGVSTLFLILSGKFLEELFGGLPMRQWIIVAACIGGLPVLVLRTVAEVRGLPLVGVVAVSATVVAVLVEARSPIPAHTDVALTDGLIPAFSGMCLSFAAHAGLPSVEAAMREPHKFDSAVNLAYALVLAIYLPLATVGYAVYGDAVFSPILCSLPRHGWVQKGAKSLITIHVLLTYPVLMTLFLSTTEQAIGLEPGVGHVLKRTLLRAACVSATALIAVAVPYFADVMSLLGAVCVVMTTFVLPALFYSRLVADRWRDRLLPLLVAGVGAAGGAIGAVQAGIALAHELATHADPDG